jgi:SH3 and cysteine-rich domain-containing protein 2
MSSPSNAGMVAYFDAHNAYVQQLHATNGMLSEYSHQILPQLMQVKCATKQII